MPETTPADTVAALVRAINLGDLDAAVALYRADAIFVAQQGTTLVGREAIREALAAMLATAPKLATHSQQVLLCADHALYHAEWSMTVTAPDGSRFSQTGHSCDLICRAADGRWRIAIDNPWGACIQEGKLMPATARRERRDAAPTRSRPPSNMA